jgi:hypothetical protein
MSQGDTDLAGLDNPRSEVEWDWTGHVFRPKVSISLYHSLADAFQRQLIVGRDKVPVRVLRTLSTLCWTNASCPQSAVGVIDGMMADWKHTKVSVR